MVAVYLFLLLELFQSPFLDTGLVMGAISICPVLGCASLALSFRTKFCAYYSVLPSVGVFTTGHSIL
jgi:hypothetical protein